VMSSVEKRNSFCVSCDDRIWTVIFYFHATDTKVSACALSNTSCSCPLKSSFKEYGINAIPTITVVRLSVRCPSTCPSVCYACTFYQVAIAKTR
jgi:hypothetical protein